MGTIAERFTTALAQAEEPGLTGPELLPVRLMRACARTLPVDGAGLSVEDGAGRRLPLGASSEDAATAERLQFTVGTGPCLATHRGGEPVFAMSDDLRRRWLPFAELLMSRTPYSGVVALPLPLSLAGNIAIDLYFTDEDAVPRLPVFEAMAVGALVTSTLSEAAVWSDWDAPSGPEWLRTPAARRRAVVWEALGQLSVAHGTDTRGALDLLRAAAYAAGRPVDDVAADLLSGRLEAAALDLPEGTGR
ncbi:ANTAR domain-containing protein [Blastococcus sp. TF02A-26]|uniref:ANTAR domain-containing protein n=1 Tax=Blastococcus sp. TF02A-26 TaxID=2250577 RepID=UPI000DEBB758|nr:ANTAR domain-containing protein [Blastococcus sp. TF02A-26]RBY85344.1 GAF domain-containing protein [Blastococcus sp. TF02A-26]